jgi:hypothetical protein
MTKRYKGFLAKPRKLSRAEIKRAKGLRMTPRERLDAEHDAHGHWGQIFELLCAEYGLDPARQSMRVLWMRMAKRHVPAARDLDLPRKSGRPRLLDATFKPGLSDHIDRMIGHLTGRERTEASLKIARWLLDNENPASPVSMAAIREKAKKLREASRQRLLRSRQRP